MRQQSGLPPVKQAIRRQRTARVRSKGQSGGSAPRVPAAKPENDAPRVPAAKPENDYMKRYLSKKGILLSDVGVCLTLAVFFLLFNIFGMRFGDADLRDVPLGMGYMALPVEDDSALLIDSGKSRILGVVDGRAAWELSVAAGTGDFYQAENLCMAEDGSFYVHSVDWDESGFLLASERILHYSGSGKLLETSYVRGYTKEEEVNQHRIYDPQIIDGRLYVLYADDKGITQYEIISGEAVEIGFWEFEDAWIYMQNFRQTGEGEFYAVEKKGHLTRFSKEGTETVYDADELSHEVLFFAEVDSEGNVYYTDLYNGRVCRVVDKGHSEEVFRAADFGQEGAAFGSMTSLKITSSSLGDYFGFMLDGKALILNRDGGACFSADSLKRGSTLRFKAARMRIILAVSVLYAAYLVLRILFYLIEHKPKLRTIWKMEIGFGLFAVVMTSVLLVSLSTSFERSYMESLAQQVENLALSGSNMIDAEWLKKIDNMSDFMGEEYRNVLDALYGVAVKNHDYDDRFGAQMEMLDEDGRAYAIAYSDSSIGVYYPLDEYSAQELAGIYASGEGLYNLSSVFAGGTFIYGRAPVFDDQGNVAGVLDVALDSYRERESLRDNARSIMVSAVLSIIVIMFLINESFSLADGKKKYEEGTEITISGSVVPVYMLRLAAFGVCFVLNMTSSFLSVYTSSFWSKGLGISEAMAGAVPLFANGVFSALSALVCPKLMEKAGFRRLAAAGILCSGAGDLLAGLSRGYPAIVLALLLNGLGFGILINSVSITIGRIDDDKDREDGYAGFNAGCVAGINCGMIVGSILVSFIEYHEVFFITSALWLSLIFLFWNVGRAIPKAEPVPSEDEERVRGRISPSALLYAVFVVMPYAAVGSFMYYYLPILVTSGGYSEEYVSLLMMVYAVCGIFLGKKLAFVLWSKLGRRSAIFAIVLAFVGWEIIAVYPAMSMVAMAMLFIGVSFSFGVNVMMYAFLMQKGVAKMGQHMAVGVYEFASRTGQCVSPLVCSALMGMGFAYGIGVFAVGCVVMYYIITFATRRSRKAETVHE